jgi:hypothetical protein
VKGLELSEAYFNQVGAPMIEQKFPEYRNRIAAGLVGEGSESYGFDDEISRDHDWGPSFCLWLTKDDYQQIGSILQEEMDRLPRQFKDIGPRQESQFGHGRAGVLEIGRFYRRFIGIDHAPVSLNEWRRIPEVNLAAATNGKVYVDPLGEFTSIRDILKGFYPEDVRLKKIAARCMAIAQSGQYNFARCVKRKEYVAAHSAEAKFIEDAISLVFLLNRRYRPFYKWMHRALKDLPILGEYVHNRILDLVLLHDDGLGEDLYYRKNAVIEDISQILIEELRRQDLSDSKSDFLLDHGPIIQERIQDPDIRAMPVWAE